MQPVNLAIAVMATVALAAPEPAKDTLALIFFIPDILVPN